ncbi:MAG TPA: MFS transporter [Gammaproteobacteria bacterium]
MSVMQIVAVAITIGLNALDGFDVMSISFASPGIAEEWGMDRAELGIVLSMELIGMAFGSILLGGVADALGRRRTVLGCLLVMAVGMFMVTTVEGLVSLSIWRIITGLGIGGMLAAINAVAAEFSNKKRKHLNVSLMAIGYPIGAVVGGLFVVPLLANYNWRSVFYFGTTLTAIFIPLVYFFVPESVHWLARKQPAGALERINGTLARMGHAAISALPSVSETARKRSATDLFTPALIAITLIVTASYFFHITTFYFIIKWVPKIVADMGFTAAAAAGVLTWVNAGGATGGAVFGLLTLRFGLKPLTIAVLVLSTVMVVIFGRTPEDLVRLSMICFAAGFCTNAGIVGLYAIFAHAFPTHVRASGTGVAIGIGRGGAVLAPIISGFLFDGGIPLHTVALIMGLGSLCAAGLLAFLKLRPDEPAEEHEEQEERAELKASPAAS